MAVAGANRGLHQALLEAGPSGAQDAALCGAAAAAWRGSIAAAVPPLQAAFDAGDAPVFLRHALGIAAAALAGAWALMTITTGRRLPRETVPDEAELEANPAAAAAMLGGGRDPPCTAMQGRWAMAFGALLGAAVLAGYLVFDVVWAYGDAAKAVEYAAKPLATTHNWVVGPSGAVAWHSAAAHSARRGHVDGAPWVAGEFASALHNLRVTPECAAAMQPAIAPLTLMPPTLRVPLRAVCPAPLRGALHVVGAVLMSAASRSRHAASISAHDDVFVLDDPFAGTSLHGWLDGNLAQSPSLVLPSHVGASFAVVTTIAWVLGVFAFTMAIADAVATRAPQWMAWVRRRGLRARHVAAAAARSHVHAE